MPEWRGGEVRLTRRDGYICGVGMRVGLSIGGRGDEVIVGGRVWEVRKRRRLL